MINACFYVSKVALNSFSFLFFVYSCQVCNEGSLYFKGVRKGNARYDCTQLAAMFVSRCSLRCLSLH